MKKLLLIGGGGHCKSVLDSILATGLYDEIGIVDKKDSSVSGIEVVGNDDDLQRLRNDGWTDAFVTVGSIGNTNIRRKLYKMAVDKGFNIPVIVDPTAVLAKNVTIGQGSFIGKKAVINSDSIIGTCCIINSGAIIEHDCIIGDFSHVSPGAVLCGMVTVENDSHIGAGAIIRQQIRIGKEVLIGAGSVVVNDISEKTVAYGNPCRVVE